MTEKYHGSPENKHWGTEQAAHEALLKLQQQQEKEPISPNKQIESLEKTRTEAHAEAIPKKEYIEPQDHERSKDNNAPITTSTAERERGYHHTMQHVQSHLNASERTFSKLIHNKVVERVSDATGATIARPNAVLFGSIFAFFGVLALYFYARHMGFALTGFQTIGAFIVGWLIGMLVDFVRVTFRRPR